MPRADRYWKKVAKTTSTISAELQGADRILVRHHVNGGAQDQQRDGDGEREIWAIICSWQRATMNPSEDWGP
jgi:hypothetical protein